MAVFISVIAGVIGAAPKILSLFAPLKKHISYASRCNDFIRDLGIEVGRLNEERESLQGRIGFARRNLEVIRSSVEGWIRRANEMITEANRILDTVPEVQNCTCPSRREVQNCTCPSGTCPNLKSRYSLGKQAKKMTEDVKQLREECGTFERVSDPAPPTGTETIPPTTSGILEFESRKRKEEGIMECLREDKILMIGICGMGGVGKTTMVDKIVKRAREEKLFDEIVKVIVSRSVDLLNIQKQIASPLGLQLEDEKIVSVLANRLHKRLLAANKILLYFDDVWERLDLEGLGIPSQCKIILTSRDQEVCRQMMTIEDDSKILKLDGLSKDESWELFREKTGSVVNNLHLRQSAVEVAKECKGLPLALATVGRAMREKTERAAWDDALHQLRVAAPANIRGYIKEVYQHLKLSYHALETVEAMDFFLLCCLFPKDSNFSIEDLVYYGVALRIFSATTNIRQARNRAHNLVDMLKSRFLLMDADHSKHTRVKMHDVIRDMALSIASRDEHGFMVSHYTEAWPEDISPENCTRISLILGQEAVLPKTLKYPRLEALHLEILDLDEPTRLPESFFDGMAGLRFLRIKKAMLSPTLRMLAQLRVLNLPFCGSKMICEIGELVNLEILSLHGSDIEMLPKEIGALTKLKLLNLNYSKNLKKIVAGVVSSLIQLEELRLRSCPIEWEVEERGSERSNASLTEVFSLRNLRVLEIQIGGFELIPQDTGHLNELTSYSINIGKPSTPFTSEEIHNEKCMIVQVVERNAGANAMSALFVGVEKLGLSGSGTQDIIDLLARQGFQNLKELKINYLDTTKHLATTNELLNDTSRPTSGIFHVLRKLCITRTKQLEEIFHGPPIVGSFSELQDLYLESLGSLAHLWKDPSGEICLSNLKRIKIFECANLKWVFPLSSVAQSLRKLEEIDIEDCPNLEEVFKDERVLEGGVATFHHISFQKLKRLILRDLPKLSTLCKAIGVFEFPSIEILEIDWLPNLNFFTHQQQDLSNKEALSKLGMEKFYHDVLIGNHRCLRALKIGSLRGLRTLFSPEVFIGLIHLTRLVVYDCPMLEKIIELEGNEEQRGRNMIEKTIIPRLWELELTRLPEIRYFCTFSNALEFPALRDLTIQECPMMMTFALESHDGSMSNSSPMSFLSKQVICPNLERLYLIQLNFSTTIFSHEIPTVHVSALQELDVYSCHSLKSLFSPRILGGLTKFRWLTIMDCSMLEEVIAEEGENVHIGEIQETKVVWNLPKLEVLALFELPRMHGFSEIHSDLELPLLSEITIEECPEVKNLSLDLRCLPKGVKIRGITDPKDASRFFFNKELTEDEDCLNHGCFKFFQSDLSFNPSRCGLFFVGGSSNEFFFDGWKNAHGEIEIEKLSLGITYEVIFMIRLVKRQKYLINYNGLKLIINVASDMHEEDTRYKPKEKWIEILGGEFTPTSGQHGQLRFSIAKNKDGQDGVLLKGVYIRPK